MSLFDSDMAASNAIALAYHGDDVTYKPAAGGAHAIKALEEDPATFEASFVAQHRVYWIRAADLPANPVRSDVVTIGGVDYNVHNVIGDHRRLGFHIFIDKN